MQPDDMKMSRVDANLRVAPRPGAGYLASGARYENTLVCLLSLSAGLLFLDRLGIVFVFPQIQHDLKLDQAQLGMLMGVTALTWAISAIIVSFLSDVLGQRVKLIIIVCLIGFSTATGCIAFTHQFSSLLALRAVAGAFFGPALPLMQSLVAKTSSPRRLGFNMGLVIAGISLFGSGLPPLLMVLLASAWGWHVTFLWLAMPGFLLAAILAFVIAPDARGTAAGTGRPDGTLTVRETLKALAIRNIAMGLLGGMALVGFLSTFASFSPVYLAHETTMPITMRTALLTAMGLTAAAGTVFAPALSDRLPRKLCAIAATACTMVAPVIFLVATVHFVVIPILLAVQFVAGGAMTMIIFIIPGESVPRRLAATSFALVLSLSELIAGSLSALFAGALADRFGLAAAMWFCCVMGAVALSAALGMKEPPRQRHPAAEGMPLKIQPAAI